MSKNIQNIDLPKISIVTPSYNQGQYIEETIRSVLSQNYPNLEYIIIDGGSTDETIEIIKKYEPWITYWVSEPDEGQSHAINKGLEKCTGEIFNWLNSDDWYMPGALFEVANAFLKHSTAQFVSGFENRIDQNGVVTLHTGTFLKPYIEETIEFCEVSQPSTFFKMESIRKVNGVSEGLHYIMDGEMWVKLLLLYGQDDFIKLDKVLVNFRLHPNSKTVSNAVLDNFWLERSNIILNLLRSIALPGKIVHFYRETVYQSPKLIRLERNWVFNDKVISPRKLRIYYIKKYMLKHFLAGDNKEAAWAVKQLILNRSFDFVLLKSIVKLLFKSQSTWEV
jgi:glycosyltransferase involved in cell wall biosynthesis